MFLSPLSPEGSIVCAKAQEAVNKAATINPKRFFVNNIVLLSLVTQNFNTIDNVAKVRHFLEKIAYFALFFNSLSHFWSILYSFLVILMKLPCRGAVTPLISTGSEKWHRLSTHPYRSCDSRDNVIALY